MKTTTRRSINEERNWYSVMDNFKKQFGGFFLMAVAFYVIIIAAIAIAAVWVINSIS